MLICIILVTLAYTASSIAVNYNTNHILEYVKRNNYPIEVHNLNTSDGYELNIHRIPHGLDNNSSSGNRSVILLVHGLQESAEHWMINGNKSLAFLLANLGYDVWMANARGTYHSRGHTRYDTSNPEYWDFSWHEIGLYDHPATIDYILSKTGVSKLSYIGHSQGVTSFLALTSIYPEYNDKIKIMIGLAPAAYMAHVKNPVFMAMSRVWELV
ncbi:lysosomal acid lipase-related [Holotrichia oblita]|uniref:Lysosomal acid lipase-related n=1 Tax=Holotrichia oblita TaxID=644536 RepID=A0ACB9TSP4_HOLOL|nr:lysosomal acid lipase-related [Holotrichia oblita]